MSEVVEAQPKDKHGNCKVDDCSLRLPHKACGHEKCDSREQFADAGTPSLVCEMVEAETEEGDGNRSVDDYGSTQGKGALGLYRF